MTKVCQSCGIEKPTVDFSYRTKAPDGLQYSCRACDNARNRAHRHRYPSEDPAAKRAYHERNRERDAAYKRAYAERNREAIAARTRDWTLKKKYNISSAQWDNMFAAQGHACAGCGSKEPLSGNGWHTDHCHATGVVRGILCHHCNVTLGYVKDSPETLMRLYSYLTGQFPPV